MESDRFVARRSHYLFASQFTTPGIEGAHEKINHGGREAEMAERAERREKPHLIDAGFPQIKRPEDFCFSDNPKVPQATIAALAEGS